MQVIHTALKDAGISKAELFKLYYVRDRKTRKKTQAVTERS